MGNRVIYDSGLLKTARVCEIIRDGSWRWPLANSPELLSLKETTFSFTKPATQRKDKILWIPARSGLFSITSAWNQLREKRTLVPWRNLIWFHGRTPKHAFILWMAVKGKLNTQDRLHNPVPGILCLYCGNQLETHNHLFFNCLVTQQVWALTQQKGGFQVPSLPWENLVGWMSNNWRGNSLERKIKKLCLATTVYILWNERNRRFHDGSISRMEDIFQAIVVQIRQRISTYKSEDSVVNRAQQALWSFPDSIFGH